MSVLRRFLGALLLGLVVLSAAGFATGHLSSVVTNGVSMQPGHDPGDLVVVMRADRYAIGDVAAYRDPDRDEVVLHRIVGGGAEAFRLRGDNNQSVDLATPSAEELLGRQVLHVPRIGRWLGSPVMFAAAAGIAIALAAWATLAPARRRKDADASPASPASDPTDSAETSVGAVASTPMPSRSRRSRRANRPATSRRAQRARRWRWWHVALVAGDVAVIAGLVVAFVVPPTVVPPPPVPMHVGSLSYRAEVPVSDAYPEGVVQTGDSVFARVTDDLDVVFRYEGDPAVPATARLRTVIDASGGWTAAYELVPPTDVVAGGAELVAALDLAALRTTLDDVEAQTGITLTTVQLRIEALVEPGPSGQADVPPASAYALTMFFRFDDLGLDLAETSVVTSSLDGPVVTSTEPVRDEVEEPREVGGVPREARRWLVVALLVLIAGTVTSWPTATRPASEDEPSDDEAEPAVPVRRVAAVDLPAVPMRVQLASRHELDAVARAAGVPVLERDDGWAVVVTDTALHWWEPPSIPATPPRWVDTASRATPASPASTRPAGPIPATPVGELDDVWAVAAPLVPVDHEVPAVPVVPVLPAAEVPPVPQAAAATANPHEDVVSVLRDEVMGPRRPLFRARPATPAPGPRPSDLPPPVVASRTTPPHEDVTVRATIDEIVAYLTEVADRPGRTTT